MKWVRRIEYSRMRRVYVPVLIRLAKSKHDVLKFLHDITRGMIHQLKGALVVWFREIMRLG